MNSSTQPLQSIPPSPPVASAGSMLTQVSSVLALIVLLILACAWLARRCGFAPKRVSSQSLNVSASVSIGQRERVVIVDIEDARLVLGVTAQNITHLHTLPPKTSDSPPAPVATADFRHLLQTLLKRSGKPQ
ncbi:flagellar biosynthetic protein FliO [Winslowiella iniecta]|uniref:Flagellar protein n=1 Tax=Winslowiella iniecta TaxID=1560201 RepID=A0A0L7T0C3_9GAMM|nr:flagellar biosynthetic protein FliO [Winslowiella iniecta]KOC88745.1 flagellar assembly protein FliO [Winslowiella iniecta]KOC90980.1 flagellar assembly protein FliO [Winslowiella iniecta]